MDFFGTIAGQMSAVRLPLFAVTLTAIPRANTPVLLMLHWHGFRRELPAAAPRESPAPVPGSALQINEHWRELASIDEAMLDAAWRLGAWQLEREEKRACATPGASERESFECRQAFGDAPHVRDGREHLVAEAPDRSDMLSLAAEVGYVRWQFRPVQGGVWQQTARDDTLSAAGGREPPCPVGAQAPVGPRVSRIRYRLGRLDRLILP